MCYLLSGPFCYTERCWLQLGPLDFPNTSQTHLAVHWERIHTSTTYGHTSRSRTSHDLLMDHSGGHSRLDAISLSVLLANSRGIKDAAQEAANTLCEAEYLALCTVCWWTPATRDTGRAVKWVFLSINCTAHIYRSISYYSDKVDSLINTMAFYFFEENS